LFAPKGETEGRRNRGRGTQEKQRTAHCTHMRKECRDLKKRESLSQEEEAEEEDADDEEESCPSSPIPAAAAAALPLVHLTTMRLCKVMVMAA
jgi:hypothetical protein